MLDFMRVNNMRFTTLSVRVNNMRFTFVALQPNEIVLSKGGWALMLYGISGTTTFWKFPNIFEFNFDGLSALPLNSD